MLSEKEKKLYIDEVVESFYRKAINDIFIGYQFKKISNNPDNLNQVLSDFKPHLLRIKNFWYQQFSLPSEIETSERTLFHAHDKLNIRRGELGRWMTLFKEELSLSKIEKTLVFRDQWLQKIEKFEKAFVKKYFKQ
ncbi:MAG: hypothetical protein VX341_09000 [Bdellovibrionota bacterium]|nr:hypothetical protein [Bdellovibrionota bacterium]